MLRPYVCVACEKVIVGQDGVPSLIGLFSKLNVVAALEAEIPRNAVAPKEWTVFSIWDPEPGDEKHEYTLCTDLLYPDKSQFGSTSKLKIPIQPNKRAQMVVSFNGFPVGQPGEHTVRTWVELQDEKVFGPIEFGIGLEVIRHQMHISPAGLNPAS